MFFSLEPIPDFNHMMKKIALSLFLLFLLAGLNPVIAQEDTEKDYNISTNDIIDITVYGESDLTTTVRVATDGTVSYPLLGDIKAEGYTVRQFESNITRMLGEDYLVNPQVKVFVKQYANISVLGEVKAPGSYQMREKLNLTEAVALAGGFTPSANSSNIKVIRTVGDKKETISVDFDKIMEKALADFILKSNDTIIVEPYGQFSIIGQVSKPGIYNLKKNLTVVQAIGLAGGFTPIAAQNATKLFREQNGKKVTIKIPIADIMASADKNRDLLIQKDDTIVVPESFF
jgi:polysaccharide export outer membrane protein